MRKLFVFVAVLVLGGCADSSPSAAQVAEPPADATVLAVVDGRPITEADIRAAVGGELSKLEAQVYDLKRQQLDALIAERLIAAEAKRQGVSPDALEAAEVSAKVTPVTDDEVASFIAANRTRIRGDADALRPQIREFLEAQKRDSRRAAYVDGLRADAEVTIALEPPVPFRATVNLDGAPVRGQEAAPVTIVEFSDFHCPFCRSVQPTLTALLDRYEGKVRLVYKHLPLDTLHPQARRASVASWCAGQQNRFWEFHDVLYRNGSNDAGVSAMTEVAKTVGLDEAAFARCLADDAAAAAVNRDVVEGSERLGLTGTPGFFINGRELTGAQPIEAFARIIDEELARQP